MVKVVCECGTKMYVSINEDAPEGTTSEYTCLCGCTNPMVKKEKWEIGYPEPHTVYQIMDTTLKMFYAMLTGKTGKEYPDAVDALPQVGDKVTTDQGRRIIVASVRVITQEEYLKAIAEI